ncbi:unnamed protein product, partial [Ectocarpus sp. 4 AP-2014]
MFGTARRRQEKEGETVPILREKITATAGETTTSPAPLDGRIDPRSGTASWVVPAGFDDDEGGRMLGTAGTTATVAAADEKLRPLLPESVLRGLAYGMVNGILEPPIMASFAAMIFRDPAFTPHLPKLVKLVMFSAAVHMACFGTLSRLKFAVGAVQDAGLIFLSAISSSVVAFSREQGVDEAGMLSTSCFVLCTCTGLLGVALVVLGRLRLASVVQYLPMPVIGGYLAYIGWFCGEAGLAFACGLDISGIGDLGVLANREALLLVLPAVLAGLVMYLFLRRFPSPTTLPLLMAAFLGTFFAFLTVTETTLEEARAAGWVSAASPMLPLNHAWDYFSFADIHYRAFVRIVPNLLAMIVVVAFSSCLDIAAIEMEMAKPLDFNKELQTVGWSNVISGLFGGFTGSYIFSQTIFNLRAGVDTRAASAMSFVMLLAVAASPASVISFLPRCFFGSLLILVAVDLMVEWLWQARLKMMPAEYLVCLATFCSIQAWGVEKGMVAGLVLAALSFTITYAQVPTVMTARVKASTVMRTFEERVILKARQEQTVVLELQGYIFFGSAVKILSDVKDRIVWSTDPPPTPNAGAPATGIFGNVYDDSNHSTRTVGNPQHQQQQQQQQSNLETAALVKPSSEGTIAAGAMNPRGDILSPVFNRSGAVYRPSSATAAEAAAAATASSVLPGSSPLRWRTPRQVRSQLLREHTSTSSQQQGGPSSQGISSPLAQSLARTRSAGGTTTTPNTGVFGAGGGWGRRFHRAGGLLPGATEQQETEKQQLTVLTNGSSRHDGGSGGANFSVPATETTGYGAMEEGGAGGDGGVGSNGGGATAGVRVRRPRGASLGEEPRVGEGAVQAYMSLWANGGGSFADSPGLTGMTGGGDSSPGSSGRMARSSSVVSLLPASEERTRRVILDFSNVVGVDATAARSCFLMLKIVLRTSGADVVFSGATRRVQALLRSHGVITDDDPVFNSLDTALEWSEEMMLDERREEMLLRGGEGTASPSLGGSLLRQQQQQACLAGTTPPPLALTTKAQGRHTTEEPAGGGGGMLPAGSKNEKGEEEEGRPAATAPPPEAEAAVFLGDHEDYYLRAGTLRRRTSFRTQISDRALDNPFVVGDVGSLQSILEDYLEVDRYQAPESVRTVLGEAKAFFRQEHVAAGAVLADHGSSSSSSSSPEKVYFIGSGSVELQIPGECGPRRLQKVCAGGTFGEMGYFLRTPQAFRTVAREPCHLHTLDRAGMAAMQ